MVTLATVGRRTLENMRQRNTVRFGSASIALRASNLPHKRHNKRKELEQCISLTYIGDVNLWTVARYLLGNSQAIWTVATTRAALWTGIVLVLLTAVARNYDQNFILETPLWLFGSLLFSFFSGSFLFCLLYDGFIKRHLPVELRPARGEQWCTFMALFWMTAPIAWLYAIPVERFFDSYTAAQANITLLAIVSAWRVWLMSRVVSVLTEVPFIRALGWVLFAAAIEVIIVVFFGAIFGGGFSKAILAGMGGMRHSPEETLINSTLGFAWTWSWAVLVVLIFALGTRFRGETKPLPQSNPGRMPWRSLAVLTAIWALIAWPAQREQQRFAIHAKLIHAKQYSDAIAFLAKHERRDFPPARRLEPNPYEYVVWEDLPPTIALLTTNTPPWVRDVYLSHLANTFIHHGPGYRSLTNVASMYAAIAQLPEGRDWMKTNETLLAQRGLGGRYANRDDSSTNEAIALTSIVSSLRQMGMAQTNLSTLGER